MGPRSTSRSISGPGIVVGFIRAPHGVRGEVRVEPLTDVADRFRAGAILDCDDVGTLTVASVRGTPASPILRFAGRETRSSVEELRGKRLRVDREEARRATRGAWLWADLVGLRASTPDGLGLGTVTDVIRAGGADVLVIADAAGRERLLPALESVVREVDLAAGRIVLVPQEEA